MAALALVNGSTCEARIETPEFDRSLCGKISHTKKKVGLCPTEQPATFFYESEIQDIEAGLASAERRIDAARADGAPASSSGSALHPQRHDISGVRAALA